MIKAVVFDLDDTLYDEIDYCRSGFRAVAAYLTERTGHSQSQPFFESFRKHFKSGERTRIFNISLEELGISFDNQLIKELVEVYRTHQPDIHLPSESREILDTLQKKYTLAMLTDGFLPAQRLKVKALGIEDYFKCIIYTEELGRDAWKPSTAGFEKLISVLNIPAEHTAYIADNLKKDFIAPNKLGMLTIQLIRPLRVHTEISKDPQSQPDKVIKNINELPLLLETL